MRVASWPCKSLPLRIDWALGKLAVIAVLQGGMAAQAGNSSALGRRSDFGAGVSLGIATWPVSIGGACEGKK